MASTPAGAEITRVYREQLTSLRDQGEGIIVRAWRGVDLNDLDASFVRVLDIMELVVTSLQRESVRLADLYVAAFLTAELGESVSPRGLDPARFAGTTRDGRPVRDVLALGLTSTLIARGNGRASPLASGLARSVRAARTETVDAARRAQAELTDADPRTQGWRRVSSGDPCGACLGLAGARFSDGHLFELHGACRCTAEPIVVGSREQYAPRTGKDIVESKSDAEAKALWGEEKAAGLKSGDIDPAALVTTKEAHRWGPMLYETPTSAIVG